MKYYLFCNFSIYVVIIVLLNLEITAAANKWSKWKPLTRRCPRMCAQPSGMSPHARVCLKCTSKKCMRTSDKLCKGRSKENRPCYNARDCTGSGLYTGSWRKWRPQTECPTQPCPGQKQTLVRKCKPSMRGVTQYKCPPERGVKNVLQKACPCAKAAERMQKQRSAKYKSHLHGYWKEWSEWTCLKDCNSKDVKAYRKRSCTNFMAGFYCRPDKKGLKEVEEAPCKGKSGIRCLKKWGVWGSWSQCSGTCGGDTMIRHRKCLGRGKECSGESKGYQPCPVARNCPVIDGKWGGWGRWELECSVTCGDGLRKRSRKCNQPPPSGGGRTCEGLTFDAKPCHVRVVCPIHGNWTEWTEWDCTVSCGPNGTATRDRKCDNPAPAFEGNFCRGNARDIKDSCNNMTCPTADPIPKLPEYLINAINDHLNDTYYNFFKPVGSFVKLICRSNVTRMFFKEFPDAAIKWIFNEKSFGMDLKRMSYVHGDVVISNLNSSDTGVYTCNIEYFPKVSRIVGIYSLNVNSSDIMASPRATKDLKLLCHGSPFGIVFNNTNQKWLQNDIVRQDFGTIPPQSLDPYIINGIKPTDSGIWICSIHDGQTARVWNTSRIVVKVGPAPSLWEQFLKPQYIGGFVGALLVVIMLFTGLCAKQAKSIDKKKADYVEKWKKELGIDDTKPSEEDEDSELESTEKIPLLSDVKLAESQLDQNVDEEYYEEDYMAEEYDEYDGYDYAEPYGVEVDPHIAGPTIPGEQVLGPSISAMAPPPPQGPSIGAAPPPPPGPQIGGAPPVPSGPPIGGAPPPPPGPSIGGAPPPPGPPIGGAPPPPGPPIGGAPPPPGPPIGGAPPPPPPPGL